MTHIKLLKCSREQLWINSRWVITPNIQLVIQFMSKFQISAFWCKGNFMGGIAHLCNVMCDVLMWLAEKSPRHDATTSMVDSWYSVYMFKSYHIGFSENYGCLFLPSLQKSAATNFSPSLKCQFIEHEPLSKTQYFHGNVKLLYFGNWLSCLSISQFLIGLSLGCSHVALKTSEIPVSLSFKGDSWDWKFETWKFGFWKLVHI